MHQMGPKQTFHHHHRHFNLLVNWPSLTVTSPSRPLLLPKDIATHINLSYTPDLPLIFPFVLTQPYSTAHTALGISPFPGLSTEPQRHTLEVIAHAPLGISRNYIGRDELVKHFALLINNVEQRHECGLSRQLDRDDHVANRGEYWRCEQADVWFHHVHVRTAHGAHDDERESAGVNRTAGRDEFGDGLENRFGGFEGLGCIGEEVLAGRQDEIVGNEGLRRELS